MHIIHLKDITINFAGREIFNGLRWTIGSEDRVGLVGPNGAGKSSLLKVITGEIVPEAGTITRTGPVSVGYLPQDLILPSAMTLIEVALIPPPQLAAVNAHIGELEAQLGDPAVYENEQRLTQVMEQLEAATTRYDQLGGPKHTARVEAMLSRLGFTRDDYDLPAGSLSGGQKKLVALARLALEQPNVLLLDEPDNHLDLGAKRLLEAFIRGYPGSVVIISHDRYLLDEVVNQIAELENGKLKTYPGTYSQYAVAKEAQRLRQQQQYVTQQKEIVRIEAAIARFELWASMVINERHIKQARSRRKMLDKMDRVERMAETRTMDLALAGGRGSTKALSLKQISMAFNDDPVFLDLDLHIRHGERVGVIGPNGAGKSVLFRLILGDLQQISGDIVVGPSTRVGYYAQEHQTLTGWYDRTPIEFIRDIKPMPEGQAVHHLLKFAFQYDQTRQPIGTLSGGERGRLQFLRLMLLQPNLLLLDEPTNNLDIPSVEVLESALESFEGAVLAISHDRYFLDHIVDRVVELDDGTLTEYLGGYSDYLQTRR
ncbi:MAG: ribosomal protection-like ABC-F family protein [Chloroflexota bacterium]